MSKSNIDIKIILSELDKYLHSNDYASAEGYLLSCLGDAERINDNKAKVSLMNELMGLYRKLGNREKALLYADSAIKIIENMGASEQLGSATVYLNSATVYKAFSMAEKSIPLFRRAERIYEEKLSSKDKLWGGLYNNMGLALVDIGDFSKAKEVYYKAIKIMLSAENGEPEAAITYLNLADCISAEKGILDGCYEINGLLNKSKALLEGYKNRDGNYAFVCEKCASVFGYYGDFLYEEELTERARRIYENERA